MRDWIRHHKLLTFIVCFLIVAILSLAGAISANAESRIGTAILRFFDDWSVALSAAAAVLLAIAAFAAIWENRRIREEDREQEFKSELG